MNDNSSTSSEEASATGRPARTRHRPAQQVFANDLKRPIGTYLYGRRMSETMTYWETASIDADQT